MAAPLSFLYLKAPSINLWFVRTPRRFVFSYRVSIQGVRLHGIVYIVLGY